MAMEKLFWSRITVFDVHYIQDRLDIVRLSYLNSELLQVLHEIICHVDGTRCSVWTQLQWMGNQILGDQLSNSV